MLYPPFIFKTEEGFDGYFPDIESCFFVGDGIEDTIKKFRSRFQSTHENTYRARWIRTSTSKSRYLFN